MFVAQVNRHQDKARVVDKTSRAYKVPQCLVFPDKSTERHESILNLTITLIRSTPRFILK